MSGPEVVSDAGFAMLPELIELHGRFRATRPAFVDSREAIDWAELARRVESVAASLQRAGIAKGDRVGMLCPNQVWSYVFLLGVLRAGAVAVPFSPLLTPALLARLLRDSEIEMLAVGAELLPLALAAVGEARLGQDGIRIVDEERARAMQSQPAQSAAPVPVEPQDRFSIIYSSGTTGVPKGIVHSHRARLMMGLHVAIATGFGEDDCALLCTPPHSNGTFIFLLPALICGASVILLERFTAPGFLAAAQQHRPTHVFIVPTILKALMEDRGLDRTDLSSLRVMLSAGAPIPPDLKALALRYFGPVLGELWGLTEGLATFVPGSRMPQHFSSVGRPLGSVDLRIVDAAGHECRDRVGEIVGRSSFLMEGYLHGAAAVADWYDSHGNRYLRTGDLGTLDSHGYLRLKGRLKDLIISGGLNVYVSDIESVLLQHAAVADAAVIGVADDKWGEVPVAFVRLRDGAACDAVSLLDWANSALAKHQRLKQIQLVTEDFPRNTLGKVLREELRMRLSSPLGTNQARENAT